MKYSVCLLDENGRDSYLKVKDRTTWKTLNVAKKHAQDIRTLIQAGKNIFNAVDVWVEDEFGAIV
jgi:hypothetical protein